MQSNMYLDKKTLAISSGGGHLTELLAATENINFKDLLVVTCKNEHTTETLSKYNYSYIVDPHISYLKYFYCLCQSIFVLLTFRPNVIISTGAGIAVPTLLIGKFFGAKIVFIETGARVTTPSKTARLIYKISDLFIVQYSGLSAIFPKSKIGSLK